MVIFSAKSFKQDSLIQGGFLGVLLLGLIWKVVLVVMGAFPFNADEAIVGLMGRHILQGARPIFFYGQAYMGALDAYFAALGFQIFGVEVWVIRLVQILLFLGIIATTMRIAIYLHQDHVAALLSGLLLAIPTVNFTLYTTISLGGYGESLLIGNLLLLTTLQLIRDRKSYRKFLFWGLLAGIGFWAFGLTVIYIVPCGIALLWDLRKNPHFNTDAKEIAFLLLGLGIGSCPVFIWLLEHGANALFQELLGAAIAGASASNWWESITLHVQNLFVFGPTVILGFRAPWSTEPLALPFLPFAFLFWFSVLTHIVFRHRKRSGSIVLILLCGIVLTLMLGFIVTPFGADPSGRYFLPIMIPLAILAGEFVRKPMIGLSSFFRWILFTGVLVFNLVSNWQTANTLPDRMTTQFDSEARVDHRYMEVLVEFLEEHGEVRGYSTYWIAYPLAFQSNERLVYYPALPYHHDFRYTSRDNRYPAYQSLVDQSPKVAFITARHPELDEEIREVLAEFGIHWEEETIGDYQVFFQLSERIKIEELGQRWLDIGT
jgi:4-amino-4-deoxy-L-arabinose transferase-like glycosyltransferase